MHFVTKQQIIDRLKTPEFGYPIEHNKRNPIASLDQMWGECDGPLQHELTTRLGIRWNTDDVTIESIPMLRIAINIFAIPSIEYAAMPDVEPRPLANDMWHALDLGGDDDVDYASFHESILHACYDILTKETDR